MTRSRLFVVKLVARNRHYIHTSDDKLSRLRSDGIMVCLKSPASRLFILETVYSGVNKKKHQRSAPLAFVRGIHRWPVNSPHKGPVTRKMFPFDDVIVNASEDLSSKIASDGNISCARLFREPDTKKQATARGVPLWRNRYNTNSFQIILYLTHCCIKLVSIGSGNGLLSGSII